MTKKSLSQENYDKLVDSFTQQLYFLKERWEGIKVLRDINKKHLSVWKEYWRFFDSVYRSFVYDFYIGICRLAIDETKGVESLIKLLRRPAISKPTLEDITRSNQIILKETHMIAEIKDNPTMRKIKNQRDFLLAHQNSNLLFDEESAGQFRTENNPSPKEIEALMYTLDKILTEVAVRASFYPSTTLNTSIGREIEEIFAILNKELPVNKEAPGASS